MWVSSIAQEIDNEYKRKKYYAKKKRQKCKELECTKCMYYKICDIRRDENEKDSKPLGE